MTNANGKSLIKKRSAIVGGHKTSISMEDEFWLELKLLASAEGVTMDKLISAVDVARTHGNLSSALRLHVLRSYRDAVKLPVFNVPLEGLAKSSA